VAGVPVLVRRIDLGPRDLVALAQQVAGKGGVAVLAGGNGPVHVAGASGRAGVSAAELVGKVCAALGGKGGGNERKAQGGGPDQAAIPDALALARKEIGRILHA
jgi:alanyl-tRNA synthetase